MRQKSTMNERKKGAKQSRGGTFINWKDTKGTKDRKSRRRKKCGLNKRPIQRRLTPSREQSGLTPDENKSMGKKGGKKIRRSEG